MTDQVINAKNQAKLKELEDVRNLDAKSKKEIRKMGVKYAEGLEAREFFVNRKNDPDDKSEIESIVEAAYVAPPARAWGAVRTISSTGYGVLANMSKEWTTAASRTMAMFGLALGLAMSGGIYYWSTSDAIEEAQEPEQNAIRHRLRWVLDEDCNEYLTLGELRRSYDRIAQRPLSLPAEDGVPVRITLSDEIEEPSVERVHHPNQNVSYNIAMDFDTARELANQDGVCIVHPFEQ